MNHLSPTPGAFLRLCPVIALLVVLLAGCDGGGAPDPTATSSPESAPAANTPTATVPATPTAEPEATATETPPPATPTSTATEALDEEPEPASPTPEPEETAEPASPEEALLITALLRLQALPEGWMLEGSGVSSGDAEELLCDLQTFPGRETLIAEVEAQFSSDSQAFVQGIAAYPLIEATQAMRFVRAQFSGCSGWTDNQGVIYDVQPSDFQITGGDMLAYRVNFELDGAQAFESEWVFIQTSQLVSTIIYAGPEGSDFSALRQAVRDAIPRMELAALVMSDPGSSSDFDEAVDLAAALVSHDELGEITARPHQWLPGGARFADTSAAERYPVCGLGSFPQSFDALAEVEGMFAVGAARNPSLTQRNIAFPDSATAATALDHVRETLICETFEDVNVNTWRVDEVAPYPAGDDALVARVSIDLGSEGSAAGAFVFARLGGWMTVLTYSIAGEPFDAATFDGIVNLAIQDLERYRPERR